MTKKIFAGSSVLWCLLLASVAATYAIFSQGAGIVVYFGALMFGLAIGLEAMHRGQVETSL